MKDLLSYFHEKTELKPCFLIIELFLVLFIPYKIILEAKNIMELQIRTKNKNINTLIFNKIFNF